VHTLKGHSASVNSVAFSSDGKRIVSGSDDKLILIWNTDTGAHVSDFTEMCSGSEAGSYLRLIDLCTTQL